jgi:hypothetical protein
VSHETNSLPGNKMYLCGAPKEVFTSKTDELIVEISSLYITITNPTIGWCRITSTDSVQMYSKPVNQ